MKRCLAAFAITASLFVPVAHANDALEAKRQCVRRGQLTGQMRSWYQDFLQDRLTHCDHSLDAVFGLTADR
jgi:hypothetical protein